MNNFIDINYPAISSPPQQPSLVSLLHQAQSETKQKKYLKRNLKTSNTKPGFHWSPIEQKRYVLFLIAHRSDFDLPLIQKRQKKLHVMMSKSIRMRDPPQCRSHHQKMMTKFKTIEGIIQEHQYLLYPSKEVVIQDLQSKHQNKEAIEQEPKIIGNQLFCLDNYLELGPSMRIDDLEYQHFLDEDYHLIEQCEPDLLQRLAAE